MVVITNGDKEYIGKTVDISAGGLSIKFKPLETGKVLPFKPGDRVTLDVAKLSNLTGSIIRKKSDNIIINFDVNQQLEDRLLAEIMPVTNNMDKNIKVDWATSEPFVGASLHNIFTPSTKLLPQPP